MNNVYSATFSITTPMFLGGSEQSKTEMRPASIKGALRFWWRAMNWERFFVLHQKNEILALNRLHDEEARLFGAAADDVAGGQGIFLMRVTSDSIESTTQAFKSMKEEDRYLLGLGLATFKDKKNTLRPAMNKGEFTLQLMFRPTSSVTDKKSVADALYVFGLLGSLGSRARHGMGSVSLKTWTGDERQVPATRDAYKAAIQSVLPHQLTNNLPPFTAISAKTRIDISAEDRDVLELLSKIGKEQKLYRSFGMNGMVCKEPARKNFIDDHNLIFDAIKNNKSIDKIPERAVFGLPHNYRFTSLEDRKANINYKKNGANARRSSPLLLHIHRLSEENYLAINCLLPAKFLPDGESVEISVNEKKFNVLPKVSWNRITDYLDGFERRETINVQR